MAELPMTASGPSQLGEAALSPTVPRLGRQRGKAALRIARGEQTDAEIASAVGVAEKTIERWRHANDRFHQLIQEAAANDVLVATLAPSPGTFAPCDGVPMEYLGRLRRPL